MRRVAIPICVMLLCLNVPAPAVVQNAPSMPPLVLTHVTVIDTTGGPAQPDMTLVIRGERIVEMGKSGKIRVTPGSQVVDGTGKFLIPGLWDMNVYWYDPPDYLPLLIANGVTGVRETLGYAEHHEFREQIEAGQLLGPRAVIATRWIHGGRVTTPSWEAPAGILVSNEAEARQAAIGAQEYGADFIELGGSENLSREAFFALTDEAKKRGIPLEGAAPASVSVVEASNAGLRCMDEMPSELDVEILPACSTHEAELLKSWQDALAKRFGPEQQRDTPATSRAGYRARMQLALETYDQRKAAALFNLLKVNHTWICPTLTARRNSVDQSSATDPHLKYVSPANRKWWNDVPYWLPKDRSPEDDALMKRLYQKYFEIIGAMHRAGVEFLAGTTGEEPFFNVPGFSLHDELALLAQAGFTPVEALQTATLNPARFLGREHDFGTVTPGKFADLVLLNANPLEDISNTRKIEAVVYRGRLYLRASLGAMLTRIEALASRKSLSQVLGAIIKEKGVDAAIRQYRELKGSQAGSYDFDDKYELQALGNQLMDTTKFKDAVRIYELSAEEFPRWWWVYDNLGEANMAAGEKDLAIKNYKKSLELDPSNQHAALMLTRLNSQ